MRATRITKLVMKKSATITYEIGCQAYTNVGLFPSGARVHMQVFKFFYLCFTSCLARFTRVRRHHNNSRRDGMP